MRMSCPPTPTTPTGLTRSRQAKAIPPAMWMAVAYLLRFCDVTVMEAEVSISRWHGIRFGASYSFTKNLPVRAVTRQSMERTASPHTYGRDWAYSIPDPRNGDLSVP